MRRASTLRLVVFALALGGCGDRSSSSSSAPADDEPGALTLEFLGDRLLEPSEDLGGLSAILYRGETAGWLALSDAKAEPRMFELEIEPSARSISMRRRILLTGAPAETLDPEGVASSPWDTVFVSSEANLSEHAEDQPRLLEFDPDGRFLGSVPVPDKFLASESEHRGVRHNLAFESLSLAPDGSRLFLGTESALVQDGPAADLDAVGFSRVIAYEVAEGALAPGPEYVYPLGPIAPAPELEDVEAMGGLVELAALSASRLLALERVFIRERAEPDRNLTRVRLYDIDLSEATDVRSIEALSESDAWRPVTKELVLDFDDIIPDLSPEYPRLDNFEAMGFGPKLDDGGRLLLVVSDDNFRTQQRTVFLFFRLKGG